MSGAAGWDGILDPGEEILWQGRPDPGFAIPPDNMLRAVFGIFFAGFAVFWMTMASVSPGRFWMFGLIHFAAGLGIAGEALVMPTVRRRNTWYTLTDRRAFIASRSLIGARKLDSHPITDRTRLSLSDGTLGTVHFAEKSRRSGNRTTRTPIGFERISDAREVYALMRQVQRRGNETPEGRG